MSKSWNLKLKIELMITSCLLVFGLSGCKGSDAGFAPSAAIIPPVSNNQVQATLLKNGSAITTANGWNLQVDTTDSIKNTMTTNGWKVEVKYE